MSKLARFFVQNVYAAGDSVRLDGSDAHKIRDVLRLKNGDEIEIIDSAANRFRALVEIAQRNVSARLQDRLAGAPETQTQISIAQGIPKGQKMDFVVEKLTELGAASILPLKSERTIAADVRPPKIERWRRLAKSAAQQSGRAKIPAVTDPVAFNELLASFGRYDAVLFPWELACGPPLRERLPALVQGARSILVVIGPEGGFSHAEANAAERAGAHIISLGSTILRTETAGLVALSILSYAMGV